MNVRPKRTDSEKEILEMQHKFLAEKSKNSNFQPAAQAVKVDTGKKQSIFAQSRKRIDEQSSITTTTSKNASKAVGNVLLGDIVEKPIASQYGNTVEEMEVEFQELTNSFPKVEKISMTDTTEGKSLFAMSMERKRHQKHNSEPQLAEPSIKTMKGHSSAWAEDEKTAKDIHEENLKLLENMQREEILAERAKLLQSLDPKILQFIKDKRTKQQNVDNKKQANENRSDIVDEAVETIEVDTVADMMKESESEKWVHFDVVEKDKFEWMKDVPEQIAKLKPGQSFEARFDWKGILLPYIDVESDKDNRELYLHGEEPHRPGYTLQELFRLCRSNIIQQRISAFGAISGLLNIHNQGFYDTVLDLPISKIFFLLRFGFDENSTAILEVVSRCLAMLFYNETDEVLLDIIAETSQGYLQPFLSIGHQSTSNDLENAFSKLKLTSSPFSTKIDEDDEEDSKTSMNDFQLAETDLVECLLRTNIIQRIYYILSTVRPENSSVHSCLKILIRIARSGKEACNQITANSNLMKTLFECFLPRIESIGQGHDSKMYNYPQHLVLKLFRIMISQHISFCINLSSYGLQECVKNYLYNRQDIKGKLIKVQIESLRILRSMMLIYMDGTVYCYRELLPAFRYMLEWHYQHVVFDEGGPFLIRQHASALLNAIHSGKILEAVPVLGEMLAMCSCKWFYEATKYGIMEFSQSTLLASCLNCVCRFMTVNNGLYQEFIDKYLRKFCQSSSFVDFISNSDYLSILLKDFIDRRYILPSLPNVGAVLLTNGSPQLIIPQRYPIYFLASLLTTLEVLLAAGDHLIMDVISKLDVLDCLTRFLQKLSTYANRKLATSFLVKCELRMAFKLLCFKPIREIIPTEIVLQASYNLVCCMSSEHIAEIEVLFRDILFSEDLLQFDQNLLTQWREIFMDSFIYPHRIVIPATEASLSMPCTESTIIPSDWPYMLLKTLLNKHLQQISETVQPDTLELQERDIISVTWRFVTVLESNGLVLASPTEKLMYLMISFMGPDSEFLDENMKSLLRECVQEFFNRSRNIEFKFDAIFEGKSKFENLYVLFLDQFQAASYGDETFSSLVLVPLAQKYDAKWRKMVWSEHASVLRFLNCDESLLLGSIDDYLEPDETDESLIKSYVQALNSNLLRPNTIAYRIAQHHVSCYKIRKEKCQKV